MENDIEDKEIKYKNQCEELHLKYIKYEKCGHDNLIYYKCNKHLDKGILHSRWTHLKRAKYGCKYCAGKGKTTEDLLNRVKNDTYEIISDFIGTNNPISCECKICNNKWTTTPSALYQNCGCPKCGNIKKGLSKRMSHSEFIQRLSKINNNIIILGQYQTLKTPIKCKCRLCEYEWEGRPDNLLYEHVHCPNCTSGKNEKILGELLKTQHLGTIKRHVRFNDCKYKHTLEFDYVIYDVDDNILFICEYDGEQHFRPINFSGRGEEYSQKQFEIIKIRDQIKNEYCINNKIPLIRVPYWEKYNMESFLIQEIQKLKI